MLNGAGPVKDQRCKDSGSVAYNQASNSQRSIPVGWLVNSTHCTQEQLTYMLTLKSVKISCLNF